MDLACVIRQTLALGLAWGSSAVLAASPTRYLSIINDDDRTAEAVEIRPAGVGPFQPLALPLPLMGGRMGQATAAVPEGTCSRDLRVIYRDGTVMTVTGWNVCHQTTLHIGAARSAALRHH